MTMRDLIGLGIGYAYPVALIGLAEAVRRWKGYPQDFTRKLIHIGAGMWVFGILALFDTWYIGLLPFATFIILNYIFYRYRIFAAMDAPDSTPGTIYFALSITLLFLAFWRPDSPLDRGYVAVAGTMVMTWGDALASIIGQRWGQHRYTMAGSTRTWEGSGVMLLASFVSILLTLLLVPGSSLSPETSALGLGICLVAALLSGVTAALVESVSPRGTDNLSVPLLTALVVFGSTM